MVRNWQDFNSHFQMERDKVHVLKMLHIIPLEPIPVKNKIQCQTLRVSPSSRLEGNITTFATFVIRDNCVHSYLVLVALTIVTRDCGWYVQANCACLWNITVPVLQLPIGGVARFNTGPSPVMPEYCRAYLNSHIQGSVSTSHLLWNNCTGCQLCTEST